MKILFAVGTGSFIGGVLRYSIGALMSARVTGSFPTATFCVNIFGCFLIGVVYNLWGKGALSADWKTFLATGVLGGFTTFSAFSYESFDMVKQHNFAGAAIYIILSCVFGVCATALGFAITRISC